MDELETGTAQTELTDERIDELAEGTSSRSNSREIHMTDADAARAAKPDQAASAANDSYELKIGDRTIKGTREQVIKWAQMGYGYPQKAQQLNQDRQKLAQERAEYESKYKPYQDIDNWAKANPDKCAAVERMFQSNGQAPVTTTQGAPQGDVGAAVQQALQQLLPQVLKPHNDFMQQTIAEREQAAQKSADDKLNQEVQSIREKYKDIDWFNPDDNGKTLEVKVLEHMDSNGIPGFGAGFRDFYHDQLVARAEAQAKANVSRGIQERSKLGVIGKSPTPTKAFQEAKDVSKKSYNDLEREAIEEIRRMNAH